MENRKRLYRKCVNCGRSLPVVTSKNYRFFADEDDDNLVMWQSDPYQSEINEDDTPMWLCGRCAYESAQDI